MSSPGGSLATLLPSHCVLRNSRSATVVLDLSSLDPAVNPTHFGLGRRLAVVQASKVITSDFEKDLEMGNFSGSVHGLWSGSPLPHLTS